MQDIKGWGKGITDKLGSTLGTFKMRNTLTFDVYYTMAVAFKMGFLFP